MDTGEKFNLLREIRSGEIHIPRDEYHRVIENISNLHRQPADSRIKIDPQAVCAGTALSASSRRHFTLNRFGNEFWLHKYV